LNKFAEGPDFILGLRYIGVLTTTCLAMFFGPFLPASYIIGFGTLLFQLLVNKYNFLRVFKEPSLYDEKPAKKATSLLRYIILGHVIIYLIFFFKIETNYSNIGASSSLNYNNLNNQLTFLRFPINIDNLQQFASNDILNNITYFAPLILTLLASAIYIVIKFFEITLFAFYKREKQKKERKIDMPLYTEVKYIANYDCPVNVSETRGSTLNEHIDKYLQQPGSFALFSDQPIFKGNEPILDLHVPIDPSKRQS